MYYVTANNCLNHLKLWGLKPQDIKTEKIAAIAIMSVADPFDRFHEIKYNSPIDFSDYRVKEDFL